MTQNATIIQEAAAKSAQSHKNEAHNNETFHESTRRALGYN